MKTFTIYCALILATICFMETTADCKAKGKYLKLGQQLDVFCERITCMKNGGIGSVGCPTWLCAPGKEIGYKDYDYTSVYPDCCPGPICAD